MDKYVGMILWVLIIAVFLIVWFGGLKNKKKYKGQSMEITKGWYENSQMRYSSDETRKAYFFQFDKNYLAQGHYMVDRNKQVIYEEKVLYGDAVRGYEADFTNHLIDYTHHHKMSATTSTGAGADDVGLAVSSSFKFDGENIWSYIEKLGYHYHLQRIGMLAYQVNVTKDGEAVGALYSSNGGKNYFGCQGPIEAKPGSKGYFVVECADKDIDALFLLAIAFVKTELSMENLK